jgi:hypothetical protein
MGRTTYWEVMSRRRGNRKKEESSHEVGREAEEHKARNTSTRELKMHVEIAQGTFIMLDESNW